ncbi:MAG: sensor histidine kinase [Leucobacter sp.]|nr:sensor histidine kinase [Leucobacter sp.]
MNLVHLPLTRTDARGPAPTGSAAGAAPGSVLAAATVRAMEIGQHLIAVALTAIGVIRAIGDGVAWPAAVISGVAILAWHTAGAILPAYTRSPRLAVCWLLGFAAIWIVAVAVSAEFVWIAFLLWLLAGHLLPLRWGLLFSMLVLVGVIAAPVLHHGTTTYANVFGPLIGGIFAFGISRGYLQLLRDSAERERLLASLTHAQTEMAELQDELALAQRHSGAIAERARLSRDIHDTIAQALSSIRLLAHAGAGRTEDADAARTLAQVETLAGDSLADVRRIVAALAPSELEDDALAAALQRMLDRARDEAGLQVELHVDDALPILPTAVEVALLRTAQSALANVRLHANAHRVVMSLIDAEDAVRLDIIDDGAGFDLAAWEQSADVATSYGLRFMRTRLRELGGGLDVESAPGEGTAISVHLPIHPPQNVPVERANGEDRS